MIRTYRMRGSRRRRTASRSSTRSCGPQAGDKDQRGRTPVGQDLRHRVAVDALQPFVASFSSVATVAALSWRRHVWTGDISTAIACIS
jgi:hypothetical protein